MADIIGKRLQRGWTKEQMDELERLSQEPGITAAGVADKMKTRSVGKNAVVSKMSSMNIHLPQKFQFAAKKAAESRAKNKAPAPIGFLRFIPRHVKMHVEPTSPDGITFEQLTATSCRWPLGANPVKYCGKFRNDGQPYCPTHQALAVGRERSTAYRARPTYRDAWKR